MKWSVLNIFFDANSHEKIKFDIQNQLQCLGCEGSLHFASVLLVGVKIWNSLFLCVVWKISKKMIF